MTNEHGLTKVPYHVAIIMDGNGRWARQRGLPRLAGHRAGTENIRPVLEACVEYGVKMLTIWAFSTENWGRPEQEVRGLIRILSETIDRQLPELHANGVRLQHIGRLDRLPKKLQDKVRHAIDLTANNERITLNVAFDYGGRAEIIQAVQRIIRDGVAPEQVDEALFSQYLYTAGLPDPDLVIRTSGEFRTSNFMIWQAAYAEYYIVPVYWPDFGKEELYQALLDYSRRERRFGLITPQT
ncbi:MAG: isoprenyl transferase [Anaerolineae bacterium]|jgi:undecaprenyl diphosphate synthase|nr:isoprenyl transferase [Anaerolineae bacterium]MDH7473741.1 isoprenyl transferase [Anaerolineae bacterium]